MLTEEILAETPKTICQTNGGKQRMKKSISIALMLLLSITLATITVNAQVTTSKVEVRGEVSQLTGLGNFAVKSWDSANFAGFWYDIDENRSTETLKIVQFDGNRSIPKNKIEYITARAPQRYKVFKDKGSNFTIEHALEKV